MMSNIEKPATQDESSESKNDFTFKEVWERIKTDPEFREEIKDMGKIEFFKFFNEARKKFKDLYEKGELKIEELGDKIKEFLQEWREQKDQKEREKLYKTKNAA